MDNLFETYVRRYVTRFWEFGLGNTHARLDRIVIDLIHEMDLEKIKGYLKDKGLSPESEEIVYFFLNRSITAVEKHYRKGKTEGTIKISATSLVEEVARKYGKVLYKELFRFIFDTGNIEEHYEEVNNGGFLKEVIAMYKLASLHVPKDERFDMEEWARLKYGLGQQEEGIVEESKGDRLTVNQKLLIFHGMLSELGVQVGPLGISKAAFLRLFQALTGTEAEKKYENTSFKKSYDRMFQRSYTVQNSDLNKIKDILIPAGLQKVVELLRNDIDAAK